MDSRIAELVRQSQIEENAGNISNASQAAWMALEAAQGTENSEGQCAAQAQLAYIYLRLGRYSQAEAFAAKALEAASQTISSALALRVMGYCASYTNRLDQSEALLHQAVALSRQLGDEKGRAMGLHGLAAVVYSLRGQFELALSASSESSQINQKIGEADWGSPMIRAEISRMIGDRRQSRAALEELAQVVEPGSALGGVYCCYQARLALDEDSLESADHWLRESRSIAEAVGNPVLDVWLRVELSRLARLQGDIPAALAWAEDGVSHGERSGFNYIEALARVEQARAIWAGGNPSTAQALLEEVLQLAKDGDLRYEQARITFFLAALAQQQEQESAATLWIAAANRLAQGGWAFLLERERSLAFPLVNAHLKSRHAAAQAAAKAVMEPLARIAPLPLHIHGLGRFHVRQGRRAIPDRHWQRRKAGELFRYLLLQPDYTSQRESLIEALWPGQPLKSGQAVFHQATSAVRRILEPDLPGRFPSRYLVVEEDLIALYLPPGSTIDFEHFKSQARLDLKHGGERLAKTLSLYTDDLFPADRYADWSVAARELLAQLYLRGLSTQAAYYLDHGFPQRCLDCCDQILAREAWHEDAVLLSMRARVALHDRPGALVLYDRLAETLREELGLAPRADLKALAESLRGR